MPVLPITGVLAQSNRQPHPLEVHAVAKFAPDVQPRHAPLVLLVDRLAKHLGVASTTTAPGVRRAISLAAALVQNTASPCCPSLGDRIVLTIRAAIMKQGKKA